jgi:endoglucanase
VVILDNHRSRGDWCCDTLHGDGLWYTADYPQAAFIADWQLMTQRYLSQPAVVGMDLRNELRYQFVPGVPATCTDCNTPDAVNCTCERATWGDMSMTTYQDWTAPAEQAGNAILAINPQLLIVIEGPDYSTWLGASYLPLQLNVPNRLVYSAHNYEMSGWTGDCAAFKTARDGNWGFVVTEGAAYTAPLWLGEFGVDHDNTTDAWWLCIQEYMQENDFDWAYWPLNGTEGPGYNRVDGQPEGYGVLDPTWMAPANPAHLQQLQALQAPTSGPGVGSGN